MSHRPRLQHCPACGAPVAYRVPADDNRERATCTACGEIHYENPLNVVGTVPVWGEQVLLCRRAIEPRRGYWSLWIFLVLFVLSLFYSLDALPPELMQGVLKLPPDQLLPLMVGWFTAPFVHHARGEENRGMEELVGQFLTHVLEAPHRLRDRFVVQQVAHVFFAIDDGVACFLHAAGAQRIGLPRPA